MEVLPRALAARTHCSVGRPACSPNRIPVASIFTSSLSVLASSMPSALALNYDELVKGPNAFYDSNAADSFFFIDFDAATDFVTANPVAFLAGLAAVAVPLVAFTALAFPQTFGSVSPAEGFKNLAQPNVQLLDIRSDARAEGSPNLESLGKKAVVRAYNKGDDAEAFVAKVVTKFKDPSTTTLYILDRGNGNSLEVAKLLANNGFEGAFAIKGGAEGWKRKELPWSAPRKGFSIKLDGVKDILDSTDTSSLLPTTLGVAVAAGIGAAVFTEAESALQLLGSAALIQIFVRKFMFAKDREKTIADISSFLDTKIAPNDFADELKEVGRVLLRNRDELQATVKTEEVGGVPEDGEVGAVESGVALMEEEEPVESGATAVEEEEPVESGLVAVKEEETVKSGEAVLEEKEVAVEAESPY